MFWPAVLIFFLSALCLALMLKVRSLRRAAKEIRLQLSEKLETSTNTTILLSCRDRELTRLAASLNRELRRLRDSRLRYEQGDQELKNAVTNLSHDLRTPLTAILGYLDLLDSVEKSPRAGSYLAMIRNRSEFLRQQMEELFRYSIAASAPDEERESLSLGAVLEESLASYYGAMTGQGLVPEISIPEKKVERYLNRSALIRIFGNIISNALKYSEGDLSVVMEENGSIRFSNQVRGMDAVSAGRLFDRFYTVETGRQSTGLGLSIAKLLTERMGGTIDASLEKDRLTIFLYFPAAPL